MPDHGPRYRFRGNVDPDAVVARPVAAYRNAANSGSSSGSDANAPTSATLDIFDCIDSWGGWFGISASDVDRALKQIGDVDTLYVRLNSPGGEAQEGVAIANLLRATKATVRVTVYGIAASAASVIAIAGDSVSMAPGSILMIHDAWDIVIGSADDLRRDADALDAVSNGYADLYAMKAGGTRDEWRAVMKGEKWYPAQDAVAAKLADRVGLDPELPADLPPVETDDEDAPVVVNVDVEINPAAIAASRRFDMTMFRHAPAALAPQAPAEQPVTPPTTPEEADTMSDTIPKAGLIKALGLADDADEDTILDALDGKLAAKQPEPSTPDVAAMKAALEADGKVVISKNVLDELTVQAQAGAQARAKQLEEERDATIAKAFADGKISADRRDAWKASWDKDPEGTKADLESLPARFPVGALKGVAGSDESDGQSVAFNDEQAAAVAAQFGVSKEALLNG